MSSVASNDNEPKERISALVAAFIIGITGFVDFVKFFFHLLIIIPILGIGAELLGDIIGWFGLMGLTLVFVFTLKRDLVGLPLLYIAGAGLADVIPIADSMGWNTLLAWRVIHRIRKEDKKRMREWRARQGGSAASEATKGATNATSTPPAANDNGEAAAEAA